MGIVQFTVLHVVAASGYNFDHRVVYFQLIILNNNVVEWQRDDYVVVPESKK